MKIVGIIPARYASTRFPGKPLALLQGKPMILWTLQGAKQSRLLSDVFVATDDERIATVVRDAGGKVVMTESALPSGTDRVYAASSALEADVLVNIQGDEPMVQGQMIDLLAEQFVNDPALQMATLAHPLKADDLNNLNAVKVVTDRYGFALYFSRYPIPYSRVHPTGEQVVSGCSKHVGMYAYKKDFLQTFCASAPVELEIAESLEQLRALHLGAKIKVVQIERAPTGVDTPEDMQKLEAQLAQKGSR